MSIEEAQAILEAADELAEQPQVDEIRAEVAAVDVGKLAGDDEQKATVLRYLRRRSQVMAEITFIKDQTAALIKSLENKLKGLDYVFEGQAQDFTRRNLNGKAKSIKTPFGVVGFRTVPGGLVVSDESALLNAAMMAKEGDPMQDYYELKPVLKKSAIQAAFKETGELPPHCEMKEPVEKFYIK